MAKYLLDSNTISDFYDKYSAGYPIISAKMSSLGNTDTVFISILTLYEMEYGYANAPNEKKVVLKQKITEVQQDFGVLSLLPDGARLFGELKKSLKDVRGLKKENVKKYNVDIMIATTAISEGCILVSADTIYDELQQFNTELKVTNWLC